jgi:hypothetical protein
MTAKWTPEIEERFTELRLRQLSGNLTEAEQEELAEMRAVIELIESEITVSALKRLESEQAAMQKVVDDLQVENHELVQLLNQQALLIADTKRWLKEFEQRYSSIRNSFSRLTRQSVTT